MNETTTMTPSKEQRNDTAQAENLRRVPVYTPRVDIWESEEELVLYADLPGVKAEDVDIRFENNELEIRAKCPERQERGEFLLHEYGVGDFYRAFRITEEVDPDKISAELKHGVLTVRIPKSDAVKPKRISVKGEE